MHFVFHYLYLYVCLFSLKITQKLWNGFFFANFSGLINCGPYTNLLHFEHSLPWEGLVGRANLKHPFPCTLAPFNLKE